MNDPHRTPRRLPEWLLEAVFIVVSVLLAFAVDEYRQSRADREQARRVIASLDAELTHNLAAVEPYLAVHTAWADTLDKTVDDQRVETGLDAYIRTRPVLPVGSVAEFPVEVRRGAWDAALSTGALRLIDYELVAALSGIYETQKFYGETINRVVGAATSPTAFDPSSRKLSVRQITLDMGSLVFAERLLLDLYRKHLPSVRAAP
jgi:hypothetical protein